MLYFNCLYINYIIYIYIYNILLFFIFIIYFLDFKNNFKSILHKFFIKFFFINFASMPITFFFFFKNIIYNYIIYYENLLLLIVLLVFNTYIIFFYIKNYNYLLNNYSNLKFISVDNSKKNFFFKKFFFLLLSIFSISLNIVFIFLFQVFYIF